MNKVIICKTKNNGVSVLFPAPMWEDKLNELASKDVPSNVPYRIIDITELPQDGEFIDTWEWTDQEIVINISKAKEIWKDKFRAARKPILEKLDVEYIRALEASDTQKQQEIAAKKQELRDITEISLPDDLEGIKKIWPSILNS